MWGISMKKTRNDLPKGDTMLHVANMRTHLWDQDTTSQQNVVSDDAEMDAEIER